MNLTKHINLYLLVRWFQIVTDQRASQWLHNFEDPDGIKVRCLKRKATFEFEIVHRSRKSIEHAYTTSRIPGQNTNMYQAHVSTRSAEAKQRMQKNSEASNTEGSNYHRANRERNRSPNRKGTLSQSYGNSIALREILNIEEVNNILNSWKQSAKQRSPRILSF